MNCAAEVRDFSQIIDWKTGVDFGNITPAKRLETMTGLAGNNDRREQSMAECVNCGSYTKYKGGLCFECYRKQKEDTDHIEAAEDIDASCSKNKGLSEKDRKFRFGMIKGRIAETLIQELFLSLGFNVFNYGMENTTPGIMELLTGVRGDVADMIRRMPDFVIQDPRSNEVYFVEIKFRANGKFHFRDLPKDYPYENAYIILVSKKHIKCITYAELKDGKEITPKSRNYLGNRKEFHLQKDVIIEFCNFAVKFFSDV